MSAKLPYCCLYPATSGGYRSTAALFPSSPPRNRNSTCQTARRYLHASAAVGSFRIRACKCGGLKRPVHVNRTPRPPPCPSRWEPLCTRSRTKLAVPGPSPVKFSVILPLHAAPTPKQSVESEQARVPEGLPTIARQFTGGKAALIRTASGKDA